MRSKRIKIIYLINGLGLGGAEMMLFRLLERLNRELYEPKIITLLDLESPLLKKIEALGVPVSTVGIQSKYNFWAIVNLYKLIKNEAPVILHTQLFAADIAGRIIGRLLKLPIIITSIRNSYYGGHRRELLIKLTEKFSDRTTIVSKDAATRFIERKIIPENKLQVIYNGIDPRKYCGGLTSVEKKRKRQDLGLPENDFLMLCVGSLTHQKGYFMLLEALKLLAESHQNFYVAIAGDGPLESQLRSISNKYMLNKQIIFLGRSDNVSELMAAADLLVLSSKWEGMPGVVMEAMASVLPVVATAVGGTPELVDDGNTGYLVSPDSPEELTKCLLKVINMNDKERLAMGKAGRKRVEKIFHVDRMVMAYERLYRECLKDKNLL